MKRSQLTIAEPCHKNWESMAGDQRARHCSSCEKSVHHLSKMSADEAAALLRNPPADGLCVRYELDEAGDPIVGRRRVLATAPESQQLGASALVSRAAIVAAGLATMLSAGAASAGPPEPVFMGQPALLEPMGELVVEPQSELPCDDDGTPDANQQPTETVPVETTIEQQECKASGRLDCFGVVLQEVEIVPTIEIDRPQLMGRMPAPELRHKW